MKILMIGAHPDDCDVRGSGFALAMINNQHSVKFLSLTNGCCGHQTMDKEALAERRLNECKKVTQFFSIEYDVWNVEDGHLTDSIENRERLITEIRIYQPDIIITHRKNDYHPDHRTTAYLVQDASYLLIVPNICKHVSPMIKTPIILYFCDNFSSPKFTPDIVINIDSYMDKKYEIMACHQSQFFEWMPYTVKALKNVPEQANDRLIWLKSPLYDKKLITQMMKEKMIFSFGECRQAIEAIKFRKQLIKKYGKKGKKIKYCEAFEVSEYSGITNVTQIQGIISI